MGIITSFVNWLFGYPRIYVQPLLAGFWLITAGSGDTLTVIYPHGFRVTAEYITESGEIVELLPDDFQNDMRLGEFTYRYDSLHAGTAYTVTLHDLMGGVVERARVVMTTGISIELHYVIITNWWRGVRSSPV